MGNASTTICTKPPKKILSLWISTLSSIPKLSLPTFTCPQHRWNKTDGRCRLTWPAAFWLQRVIWSVTSVQRSTFMQGSYFKHLPVLCPEDSSLPSSSASQPSCTPLTRPFHNSLLSLRHFLDRLHLPDAQP